MMEPDFEAAALRVYEEFGIWKPGEKCSGAPSGHIANRKWGKREIGEGWNFECPQCHTADAANIFQPHDLPPPELTDAVAWQVLQAALGVDTMALDEALREWFTVMVGIKPLRDEKRALIEALAGAGQGAHERS